MPQSRILSVVLGLSILFTAHRGAAVGARSYPTSSVEFTPNRGQLADQYGKPMPEVLFVAQSKGVKCYFTKQGFHYVFARATGLKDTNRYGSRSRVQDSLMLYRVDVAFVGSNEGVVLEPSAVRANYSNYYLSNCPKGITHVPSYGTITYKDLYPRIDLVLYTKEGDENELEYDFIVHPGGDPNAIQLHYSNTSSLAVTEDGKFRMTSPFGEVTEGQPHSYQYTGENKHTISSRFALRGNILRFAVDAYNHSRDLVIDPQRLWGTYFGGQSSSNTTEFSDLAVDPGGSVNIVGVTYSNANIATTGAFQTTFQGTLWDGYVARFGPTGNIKWATYYGGSGDDIPIAITCDNVSGLLVSGWTTSTGSIASSGAFQTVFTGDRAAFLVSFDSNGARRWGTYYSGNGMQGPIKSRSMGSGVAVDSAGNVILAGETGSGAGIATSGSYQSTNNATSPDLFLAKFSSAGARSWATYVGGVRSESEAKISVDGNNNIYLSGKTQSFSLATSGAFKTTYGTSFFAKFSSTGAINWLTYYGDSVDPNDASHNIYRIAASRSGNLYFAGIAKLTGLATAGAFQTAPAGDSDAILGKFNTSGQRIWTTYYGGSLKDRLGSITVDTEENIFAAGETESSSGISTSDEYQTNLLGPYNPFIVKFDSAGHRRWATYYGRRGFEYGIGLDRAGHVFVGGQTETGTTEYASTGAYQSTPYGYWTAYIAKFCDPIRATITSSVSNSVCPGASITFTAPPGFASYEWRQNDIPIPASTTRSITFNAPLVSAFYQYTVEPVGADQCVNTSDTVRIFVRIPPTIAFTGKQSVCKGGSIRLQPSITGTGPYRYIWSPAATLDHPDSAQPIATPAATTRYGVIVTDANGCVSTKDVLITVNELPKVSAGSTQSFCAGTALPLTATTTGGAGPYLYNWSPNVALDRTDSSTVLASPVAQTKYYVTVTDQNGCTSKDSVVVRVNPVPKISLGQPLSICRGSSIKLPATASGGAPPYTLRWFPATALSDAAVLQPTASPGTTTTYALLVTDKNGCTTTDSIRISVNDSLVPNVSASGPLTVCAGDTLVLTAAAGYDTYTWSSGEKTSSITVLKSGDYSVRVTRDGCAGTSNAVHVNVLPDSRPKPTLATITRFFCAGDSTIIWVRGIPPGSTCTWSNGATGDTIYVTKSGDYSVTVTNAAGCSGTAGPAQMVAVPLPGITIVAQGPTTICEGDSIELRALHAGSITGLQWSKDGNAITDAGDQSTVIVRSAGSYTVTAWENGGCDSTSSPVIVTVRPAPTPVIVGASSICVNGVSGYKISSTAGSTIQWQLNPATLGTILDGQGSDSITIHWGNTATGTLTVTVTNGDGCSRSAQLPITIDSHLNPTITALGALGICGGDSTTLEAGNGYATYQWSQDGTILMNETAPKLTVAKGGSYTVAVTNASGCDGTSQPISVTVYPVPEKPVITKNGAILTSSVASRYFWSVNDKPVDTMRTQSIIPVATGRYTVTIEDANGCSNTSDPFYYADTVFVSVGKTLVRSKENFTLPILIRNGSSLIETGANSFAGVLRVSASYAEPVVPTGSRSGNDWLIPVSGPWQAGLDTLAILTLAAQDPNRPCGSITIDTFYFPSASPMVRYEGGTVCIIGDCTPLIGNSDTAFLIKRIAPNPTGNTFSIDYHISDEGPVSLELFDAIGRTVSVFKHEWSQAGDYTESCSANDIASGVYRLVLRSGSRTRSEIVRIEK
jgi:hypothetical protein